MLKELTYRLKYARLFLAFAKVLKLKLSIRVIKLMLKGSDPTIYQDSTGEFHYNVLINGYIQKFLIIKKPFAVNDEEVKILAINFKVLISLCSLNILKHLPFISYRDKRKMCEYLYMLKGQR